MHTHSLTPSIPADTTRAAKAAYSQNNFYLATGDRLDLLLEGIRFNGSSPIEARNHVSKPLLALVTFFQYLENLSDSQAAEATGARTDWKYALHLSLNYPGLNPVRLCNFRQVLLRQPDERQAFQQLLERVWEGGCTEDLGEQQIEPSHIVDEVCLRTRLDRVMACMSHALQALAIRNPEWLRQISLPYWYSRYLDLNYLAGQAKSMEQQHNLAETIGADIAYLLEAVAQAGVPGLAALSEVNGLYQAQREQYDPTRLEGVKLYPYCYFCGNMQLAVGG